MWSALGRTKALGTKAFIIRDALTVLTPDTHEGRLQIAEALPCKWVCVGSKLPSTANSMNT